MRYGKRASEVIRRGLISGMRNPFSSSLLLKATIKDDQESADEMAKKAYQERLKEHQESLYEASKCLLN